MFPKKKKKKKREKKKKRRYQSFSNKKKVLECVIDAGDLMGWPLRKVL